MNQEIQPFKCKDEAELGKKLILRGVMSQEYFDTRMKLTRGFSFLPQSLNTGRIKKTTGTTEC